MSKHLYWPHSEPEPDPAVVPSVGPLCAGRHAEDPPEVTVGRLCHDCYRLLGKYLTDLPGVVSWLHVNLAAGGAPLGERITGSREAPTPLRLDVLDMIGPTKTELLSSSDYQDQIGLDNIPDEIASWTLTIAEARQSTVPADDVHSMCAWLQLQTGWIAGQDWADEFLNALRHLEQQAARVAPWRAELLRDRQEPCGACGVLALVQHVGEGRIVCEPGLGGCARTRKVTDYEWHTRHLRTKRPAAS